MRNMGTGSFPCDRYEKTPADGLYFQDETTFVKRDQPDPGETKAQHCSPSGRDEQYACFAGSGEWIWMLYCIDRPSGLSEPVSQFKIYLIKGERLPPAAWLICITKYFSEEEKCCIALIRRALREGEEDHAALWNMGNEGKGIGISFLKGIA